MYGDLAGFRAYASARGNEAPSDATDALATAALVRGSDHVRLRYVANLLPAYGVDFTPAGHDLPLAEEAAYIAAALELATPGFFAKTFTASEQKVLTGVDSIKWTVVGDASSTYAAMPVSTSIAALFEPYVVDRDADDFMLMSVGRSSCL
ncbi:hypothetical protein [Stappia sp.]|uniref:hypothetical protein n=1 Tax=Stappia sp. TaxID=1870903 RepID=UPI003C7BFD1A